MKRSFEKLFIFSVFTYCCCFSQETSNSEQLLQNNLLELDGIHCDGIQIASLEEVNFVARKSDIQFV